MKSFLTFVVLALASTVQASPKATAPTHIATVVALHGQAWKLSSTKEKSELKLGDHLTVDSVVRTASMGELTLKLDGDVAVFLKGNTQAHLSIKNGEDWSVQLEEGSMLSAVKNPQNRPEHFSIRTRTVTMGVRGT